MVLQMRICVTAHWQRDFLSATSPSLHVSVLLTTLSQFLNSAQCRAQHTSSSGREQLSAA